MGEVLLGELAEGWVGNPPGRVQRGGRDRGVWTLLQRGESKCRVYHLPGLPGRLASCPRTSLGEGECLNWGGAGLWGSFLRD